MRIGNITAIAAAIAVVSFASSSSAQVFSLSPSPTVSGGAAVFSTTTPATLQQSTTLTCTVSATLNVAPAPGSNTASLSGASIAPPTSGLCGIVVFPVTPWSAQTIAGATFPSNGTNGFINLTIGANTILNDPCYGTVRVPVSVAATGTTITLNNIKLPARSGRADRECTINGVLTSATRVYSF